MKARINLIRLNDRYRRHAVTKYRMSFILCLVFLALSAGTVQAQTPWPQVAISKDGTPISYEVFGQGEPTLVFVHGWSCDARYWRMQVAHFSKKHRVIVLDLAGHGHSGLSRKKYTMSAFGEDVQSVVDAAGGDRVILIGHSMGGSVGGYQRCESGQRVLDCFVKQVDPTGMIMSRESPRRNAVQVKMKLNERITL